MSGVTYKVKITREEPSPNPNAYNGVREVVVYEQIVPSGEGSTDPDTVVASIASIVNGVAVAKFAEQTL